MASKEIRILLERIRKRKVNEDKIEEEHKKEDKIRIWKDVNRK